jgi:LPS export ABC transporter protein LptC
MGGRLLFVIFVRSPLFFGKAQIMSSKMKLEQNNQTISQNMRTPKIRRPPHSPFPIPHSLLFLLLLASCSFDYGNQDGPDKNQPDIVMENVEYVRVRSADPQARFLAERAARYEERRIMELQNFSFEQFGNHGDDINAYGRAGSASVEIDSGDISLDNGVRIDVDSEDLAIETKRLEWKDKPRTLTGGLEEEVNVYQPDGTSFSGVGFHADARRRTWEFSGGVSGTYIHEDDEEENGGAEGEETEPAAEEAALGEESAGTGSDGGAAEGQ